MVLNIETVSGAPKDSTHYTVPECNAKLRYIVRIAQLESV